MRWVFIALLTLGLAPTAQAQDALSVKFVPVAQKGLGLPHLVVHPRETLKNLTLELRPSGGRKVRQALASARAGVPCQFEIPHSKLGSQDWSGTLSAVIVKGRNKESVSMPLKLSTELLEPIKLTVEAPDVDLEKRTLRIRANRELAKAQVTLTSDLGQPIGSFETEVNSDDFVIGWEPVEGNILQMSVQGYDAHGFFGGVDLFPWRIDIPHEEVQFASGKHDIQPAEEPKLDASLSDLKAALKKYGKYAKVSLFVAGHTDTVSDAASNQSLSERRARAIARWFRKNGVRVEIRYAGFGESQLAFQTPDNTDDVRNRRVEYIVAVDPPTVGGSGVQWKPL